MICFFLFLTPSFSLELIRDVNKTLLKDLEERIENHWDTRPTIGDIFLTLVCFSFLSSITF